MFASHSPNYPQVLIGGDFNLPGINWQSMTVNSQMDVSISLTLLDCLHLNNLIQLVEKPTRGNNILDLLLTSNPNIATNEFHSPSPSHGHDAIFFEIDIRPKLILNLTVISTCRKQLIWLKWNKKLTTLNMNSVRSIILQTFKLMKTGTILN